MIDLHPQRSPPAPLLAAEGVTKIYRAGEVEVPALAGVDLALAEGELVVLLGPCGRGKSTSGIGRTGARRSSPIGCTPRATSIGRVRWCGILARIAARSRRRRRA
jgi:ABC-type glutathione transport system ATPase component